MKRLLFCLVAAGFCLSSCKQKTLKDEFLPIVEGLWVKKDYIDSVLKIKSPAGAAQSAFDLTVMQIDAADIKGDTVKVRVGKPTHTIANVTMLFQPGTKPHTIIMSDTEVGYEINGKDTLMVLHFILNGKPTIMKYIKAIHKAPLKQVGAGLDTMLNKGLIAGKYNLTENGTAKEVVFNVDGKVTGLANYKTYYVNNDFVRGMNNVDGLTFDMRTEKPSGLHFKIKGDTLDLYNTTTDENTELTTVTDLKYHLVRKK